MNSNNNNNNNNNDPKYTCISCLHPTPTLYRQYSTKYNIKLQQCTNCSKDVDKYIEHELLLVIMDIVLMRKVAYRHLIFNRSLGYYDDHDGNGSSASASNSNSKSNSEDNNGNKKAKQKQKQNNNSSRQRENFFRFICKWSNDGVHTNIIIYFIIIACLQTILKFQGLDVYTFTQSDNNGSNETDGSDGINENDIMCYYHQNYEYNERIHDNEYCHTFLPLFIILSMISMMENLLLYFGTLLPTQYVIRRSRMIQPSASVSASIASSSTSREIYLAICLPQLFNIITLLVHIYDHSSTVRRLGSIFSFGFTYMAVHCVVERTLYTMTNMTNMTSSSSVSSAETEGQEQDQKGKFKEQKESQVESTPLIVSLSKIIPGWPFLVGLLMKLIIPQLFIALYYRIVHGHDDDDHGHYGSYYSLNNHFTIESAIELLNHFIIIDR